MGNLNRIMEFSQLVFNSRIMKIKVLFSLNFVICITRNYCTEKNHCSRGENCNKFRNSAMVVDCYYLHPRRDDN